MTVARLRAWITRTPRRAPVTWTTGGTETATLHLWLELTDDAGRTGLSETPVKPGWTGLDGATALAAIRHIVAPRVLGHAPGSADAALPDVRGLPVLRAAAGHALADLRGPGAPASAPVALVVTRRDPEEMACNAAQAVAAHGVRAVKVKAGQGLDVDAAALALVRDALGEEAMLTVDANGAYDIRDGLALCRHAARHGAAFVEDPWPLAPDAETGAAVARAACAIAADRMAAEGAVAGGLLDRGVRWIAIKPNQIGPEAAGRIAAQARAMGARAVSGLFGEGPLGAMQQLRGPEGDAPCEALHFLELYDSVPVAGLNLDAGRLRAPAGRASDLVRIADVAARATDACEVAA